MLEETVAKKTGGKAYDDMTLDELDEFEDEEDDRVMQQYRYSFPYRVSRYPYPISHTWVQYNIVYNS